MARAWHVSSSWHGVAWHCKWLISPGCRGRPHVQAFCWYLYGFGGYSHCCLLPRLHPHHCLEWSKGGWEMTKCRNQMQFLHFQPTMCLFSQEPTCSWSCIYSRQWPETWWTDESHSHQTHKALGKLEKPLHTSWDLKPESLKTNRQAEGQTYYHVLHLFCLSDAVRFVLK